MSSHSDETAWCRMWKANRKRRPPRGRELGRGRGSAASSTVRRLAQPVSLIWPEPPGCPRPRCTAM